MTDNPYLWRVPKQGHSLSRMRAIVEPFCSEHMEGFGAALEERSPKNMADRVRAHQLMRLAWAGATQARELAQIMLYRANPLSAGAISLEAALNASTLKASVTDFITQMIHVNLDVYPRLLAPRLVSVQPFTQPSGYVFFLKRVARDAGSGATRELADLTTFDKNYGDLAAEGDQLKAVGITLEKELVQVTYHGLLHQHSHQADVALRTQYGLNLEALGDMAVGDELAWEVDRQVVDALVAFAETNSRGIIYFDDSKGGTYDALSPSEQQAYDKSFLRVAMTQAKVEMAHDIYMQPNWALVGTNMAAFLARTPEALAQPISTAMADQARISGAIIQSGQLRDGATLWHDPQLDPDTMVLGFTNNMNPFYAGYIMSPFGAATIRTQAFLDPDNLMRRKSQALAYAKVGVNAKQYRIIKLGTAS